jgi:hypothetical protein
VGPLGWNISFGEHRLNRTFGNTGIAVDARFGIDVQHVVVEVKSFDRTNESTVSIATVHTGFCNDVSHSDAFSLMK